MGGGEKVNKLIRKLNDPEIDKKKINSSDHFELVYLRHRYFRASVNPEPEELAKFEEMICNISDKIYLRNIALFKTLGFEMEDLRNIGRVHTVSFLSMSGLARNPDKMEEFIIRHKKLKGEASEPDEMDLFRKDAYNLARFLNQRLQEVAKFSKNKNTNVRGSKSEKCFYLGDSQRNPEDLELYYSPEVYGYAKISEVEFKKIQKDNDEKGNLDFLTKGGQRVRAVYIQGSFLKYKDIDGTDMDPRNTTFYRSPEENLMLKEAYAEMDNKSIYKKRS
tara:strand:+ start:11706 stop:12536 length:831 start_codon:yes stop_codon:yes gene_type:complete